MSRKVIATWFLVATYVAALASVAAPFASPIQGGALALWLVFFLLTWAASWKRAVWSIPSALPALVFVWVVVALGDACSHGNCP